MSRALETAAARILVLLTVMVGAVVAIGLPVLITTSADATTAVTVLTVALTALLVLETVLWVSPAGCCAASAGLGGEGPPPALSGRVTDRVHHPLRPRAPGRG